MDFNYLFFIVLPKDVGAYMWNEEFRVIMLETMENAEYVGIFLLAKYPINCKTRNSQKATFDVHLQLH